jgi:ferredoxin
MVGSENPNFRNALQRRNCLECGKAIARYNKDAKFCTRKCMESSIWFIEQMRRNARKDLNHDTIVNAFEQLYCPVLDLSREGRGMPDLCVLCGTVWHLVEIKNPATAYGRRGLSKRQQAFKDRVQGCVESVSTVEGVVELVTRWRGAPEQKIWREA